MGRLNGKIALITGAASGMGAAQARLFAREGAKVVGGDIQADLGQSIFEDIRAEGGDALFVRLDVTDAASWASAVSTAVDKFGGLSTLVNTAGIFDTPSLDDMPRTHWDKTIAVNQSSIFLGAQTAVPELAKAKGAAIVNISSVTGIRGTPRGLAYQASKGAVLSMTRGLAVELAPRGVRVNAILPGFIRTPMTADSRLNDPQILQAKVPMAVPGEVEDIASATLFLASDEARYITGVELAVDGGWSIAL
jgi:2,5-dichloro-2,5-cyclohexadiene-1,4-diol dehydrogenase 2